MSTSIESNKSTGLQSLADYINDNFDGNQSAFGREYGLHRSEVQQFLTAKKQVLVVDGVMVKFIRQL